jgi:hypothetical protein
MHLGKPNTVPFRSEIMHLSPAIVSNVRLASLIECSATCWDGRHP